MEETLIEWILGEDWWGGLWDFLEGKFFIFFYSDGVYCSGEV